MKGSEVLGKFNLIDENWILVLDTTGETKEISLTELFSNAQNYRCLAGEMKTQDFAILRILLAVLQTVFSRFDADGNPYDYIDLDDRFRQIDDVDEDDLSHYKKNLRRTWKNLWKAGEFPDIINKYLEKWHDRFYLLDDKYPFMQVSEDIIIENAKSKKPTLLKGKTINLTINQASASSKISLFSPREEKFKNKLDCEELTRWLISYHGYTNVSDKATFAKDKYQPSNCGRLYELGGIYLEGKNLFETLMLNFAIFNPTNENYLSIKQNPIWENEYKDVIFKLMNFSMPDNVAELFTTVSRAVFIDSNINSNDVSIGVCKLPALEKTNYDLEPMTIWKKTDNNFIPKVFELDKAIWRDYGLLTQSNVDNWKPGVLGFIDLMQEEIGPSYYSLNGISMKDNGNSNSKTPVCVVHSRFMIKNVILNDNKSDGWNIRIKEEVELTNKIMDKVYRVFLTKYCYLLDYDKKIINSLLEKTYFKLNRPFQEWILSINENDSIEDKVMEWRQILERTLKNEATELIKNTSDRIYFSILKIKNKNKEDKKENIGIIYNTYVKLLKHNLWRDVK